MFSPIIWLVIIGYLRHHQRVPGAFLHHRQRALDACLRHRLQVRIVGLIKNFG
jgi:hypothetical protein